MKHVYEKIATLSIFPFLYTLSFMVVVLVGFYIYFVSSAIVEVVLRQEKSSAVKKLSSDIGELESHYITLQHDVSANIARLDGYVETNEKIFITRDDSGLAVRDVR